MEFEKKLGRLEEIVQKMEKGELSRNGEAVHLTGREKEMLRLLVATFVAAQGVITIAIDETLERRWRSLLCPSGRHTLERRRATRKKA